MSRDDSFESTRTNRSSAYRCSVGRDGYPQKLVNKMSGLCFLPSRCLTYTGTYIYIHLCFHHIHGSKRERGGERVSITINNQITKQYVEQTNTQFNIASASIDKIKEEEKSPPTYLMAERDAMLSTKGNRGGGVGRLPTNLHCGKCIHVIQIMPFASEA